MTTTSFTNSHLNEQLSCLQLLPDKSIYANHSLQISYKTEASTHFYFQSPSLPADMGPFISNKIPLPNTYILNWVLKIMFMLTIIMKCGVLRAKDRLTVAD